MVNENQANLTMPLAIIQRLDKFLDTDLAKQMGLSSRPQAVIMLLREFLDKYAPIEPKSNQESEIKLVDTIDDKIILNDLEFGAIIVQIDDENKLQCFFDDVDPHDNKWVRFCLKNKELWSFLKKRNVKLVTPRTVDKDSN